HPSPRAERRPPLLSPCLLFHSLCHHRALHSFPTRRSSDLARHSAVTAIAGAFAWLLAFSSVVMSRAAKLPRALRRSRPSATRRRSEEHTSELQSRGHLVCRLLLEKKKTKVASSDRVGGSWL